MTVTVTGAVPIVINPDIVDTQALIERITDSEWEDIELAAAHDISATNQEKRRAARLRGRLRKITIFKHVDLSTPWARNLFENLEAAGVLSPGRAAAILAPVATAK